MDSVTEQSDYPKEVFFLGAGASVLAGVPTFANFREKAEDICKKKLLTDESNKQFEQVLKYWKKNYNECNVEEFYSAVEMHEMLVNNLTDKEEQKTVTTVEIENFIYSTIQKSIKSTPLIDGNYELFLNSIRTSSVIITTNWDIVLETSSGYISIEAGMISYGDAQPYKEIKSAMYELHGGRWQQRILKLHGSLNWGFCDKCGKIYYFNKKIHDNLDTGEGIVCKDEKCGGKLTHIIVPPKLSKLIKPKPEQNNSEPNTESTSSKSPYFQLRSIWSKASECLKNCEKVYFIGYSFPETDVQMKTFISNALRENSKLNKVIIVSSQKHGNSRVEFEERYLSILSRFISQSKIKFCYDGFEKFCTDLAKSRNPHLGS